MGPLAASENPRYSAAGATVTTWAFTVAGSVRESGEKLVTDEIYEPNPLTHAFPFLVGGYGWQVHGWIFGLAIAAIYVFVTISANYIYLYSFMRKADEDLEKLTDPVKVLQRIKWALLGICMVGIAISGAETVKFG